MLHAFKQYKIKCYCAVHYPAFDAAQYEKYFTPVQDTEITVKDLWDVWWKSEVHNWTVDQTVEWLVKSVGLPQYEQSFRDHQVIGARLPQVTVWRWFQSLSSHLTAKLIMLKFDDIDLERLDGIVHLVLHILILIIEFDKIPYLHPNFFKMVFRWPLGHLS